MDLHLKLILFVCLLIKDCYSLKCYVGLGNTSAREKQNVVECPEDSHGQYYVCLKMFGGGMGDQIMRKCELMNKTDFENLLEQEAAKERLRQAGEDVDVDEACYDSVHNGRPVSICHCSTDQCNGARAKAGAGLAVLMGVALLGRRLN